jgi:serine O-acetyltransferase
MTLAITNDEIVSNLLRQLRSFFDLSVTEINHINKIHNEVLNRLDYCFSQNKNKYYRQGNNAFFNPFHSGQYTVYLYYLSNSIFKSINDTVLAGKIYYLNKIMNGCDLFYEISLPDIFMLDHPVGSVMGRAKYGNNFTFGQNCTVGNNRGIFPIIGESVILSAYSAILGDCNIGNNVTLGAGCIVKDCNIPENSLVFGQSPNLIVKPKKT